ncbi:MAG: hypothetical protein ACLQAT_11385 [Candidatus Binataceae bacterium]
MDRTRYRNVDGRFPATVSFCFAVDFSRSVVVLNDAEVLLRVELNGFQWLAVPLCTHCLIRSYRTSTVDYIILLSGQVTMLLDKAEVDLKPFDVVIQRGTNHVWVNKGKEPPMLVAVLTRSPCRCLCPAFPAFQGARCGDGRIVRALR